MWNVSTESPSLTDWVQAIGALIGIIGAILAIAQLFRKDKDKQRQLTALADLVTRQDEAVQEMRNQLTEFALQTKELQAQTEQGRQNFVLLSQMVMTLSNYVDFSKESTRAEQTQSERDRRRELMPTFVLAGYNLGEQVRYVEIKLRNDGGDASNIRLESSAKDNLSGFTTDHPGSRTSANTGNTINISYRFTSDDFFARQRAEFGLWLICTDADGVEYRQILTYGHLQPELTTPQRFIAN